ncbi:MAG TPA: hypothetical protein VFG69_02160, partial [Nannocystaceae bacterium]|nr:hypothetical protein [Nannocystaceae bacterium]
MQLRSILAFLVVVTAGGCAGRHVKAPDAPLGRVIIYRNGVAYFERRAMVQDELTLDVPGDRVDDFLKSLTVVDTKTGKSLPISYQTGRPGGGGMVEMTVELPKGQRDVRIAYVTESPAWKPSYRIMLDAAGHARLQSWAIVDNVSGEKWERVRVGVGSTSALSFRYDLHSVQTVDRETIDSGVKLAAAPPQGGSPYAVESGNVRVLADLSGSELDVLAEGDDVVNGRSFATVVDSSATATKNAAAIALSGGTPAESHYRADGANVSRTRKRARRGRRADAQGFDMLAGGSAAGPTVKSTPTADAGADPFAALVAQLQGNEQRVRIEAWAKPGESLPAEAGLRRANTLRARLAERGIGEDRIEVVGHPEPTADEKLVRVVAIEGANQPVQAREDVDSDQPRGVAHFLAEAPMTIEAGHSAMVTLFDARTKAERVYLYDPVSDRGSKRFAFNAVRLVNPSENTLDSGPITVYAKQQFLGEGLTEPIPPRSSALVPYALDRSLVVDPKSDTREEVEVLQTIERGIATAETRRIRRTELDIANRGHADAQLFVRHRVATGWTLQNPPKDVERMRGDVLVPVSVDAGTAKKVVIEESMPITTTIDLRSAPGLQAIAVFLKAHTVAPELK